LSPIRTQFHYIYNNYKYNILQRYNFFLLGGWTSAADLHGMWYPPVRRTLMCLSRLYRCVDKTIFQSLSHEAVALCLKNIHQAALMISQKKVNLLETLFFMFVGSFFLCL